MSNFIELALRTEDPTKYFPDNVSHRLLHGAIGVATESGEILDAIKKSLFYGKPLDLVNLKEEVGDVLWYCALLLDELGEDFSDSERRVIEKLKARFPEGFTEHDALNRNLTIERQILEK